MKIELQKRICDIPYPESLIMGVKLNPFTTPERVFGNGEDAEQLILSSETAYNDCLLRVMRGILKGEAKEARKEKTKVDFEGHMPPPYTLCLSVTTTTTVTSGTKT